MDKTLELFRRNDLGITICYISYEEHSLVIPFEYNAFFDKNTQNFLSCLNGFENLKTAPWASEAGILQVFTSYFASFEQFISTLYEMLYFYKLKNQIPGKRESEKLFRQGYNSNIKSIFNLSESSRMEFDKTGLINKIRELEQARNYILHGNIGEITTRKTGLPRYPLTINWEDVMEEIDILVNLISFFRYIFPKLDLMPNIRLFADGTIYYKKLDDYFYNYLCPYFDRIMEKHGLAHTRTFKLVTTPMQTEHSKKAKEIGILINAKPSPEFDSLKMNEDTTRFWDEIVDRNLTLKEREQMKGHFQIPGFMIKD